MELKKIIVCHTAKSLKNELLEASKHENFELGFVPTMGALHSGHLELVRRASTENSLVVVSIFVNPTQFNNSIDLEKYPRTLENDLNLLESIPNCIVFVPDAHEIYPENDNFESVDLHGMDTVLEGEFRPGHFQGVVHVVHNFFKLIQPKRAYFGQKDFQQLAIIKKMTDAFEFPIQIVACETVRDSSGLAKSSRNMRLSEAEKTDALIIYQTLLFLKENRCDYSSPKELKNAAISFFNKGNLKLEYLEICDSKTLEIAADNWLVNMNASIAAFCGEVRLIDNMEI
ncbi:MAG: pantoate--beta-alanine ligase [Crocinitomicaceae bacterium]